MANMSNHLEEEILRWLLTTQSAMSRPSNLFIAVGTAGTDASLTEVVSGSYTRFQVTSGTFVSSGAGKFSNNTEILLPAATIGWGTISHVAIMTVVSGSQPSNYLFIGALSASVTIGIGDQIRFAPSALTVSAA